MFGTELKQSLEPLPLEGNTSLVLGLFLESSRVGSADVPNSHDFSGGETFHHGNIVRREAGRPSTMLSVWRDDRVLDFIGYLIQPSGNRAPSYTASSGFTDPVDDPQLSQREGATTDLFHILGVELGNAPRTGPMSPSVFLSRLDLKMVKTHTERLFAAMVKMATVWNRAVGNPPYHQMSKSGREASSGTRPTVIPATPSLPDVTRRWVAPIFFRPSLRLACSVPALPFSWHARDISISRICMWRDRCGLATPAVARSVLDHVVSLRGRVSHVNTVSERGSV